MVKVLKISFNTDAKNKPLSQLCFIIFVDHREKYQHDQTVKDGNDLSLEMIN